MTANVVFVRSRPVTKEFIMLKSTSLVPWDRSILGTPPNCEALTSRCVQVCTFFVCRYHWSETLFRGGTARDWLLQRGTVWSLH